MIKVKSATDETKEITDVYVKSGKNALTRVVGAYQVYNNNGKKALKQFYEYDSTTDAPSITDITESEGIVYVYVATESEKDTVEYRFTEYAGENELYNCDWQSDNSLSTYMCTDSVYIEVRSVRNGVVGAVVARTYYMERDVEHSYEKGEKVEATCTENGYTEYVCSVCGDSYKEIIPATGHRERLASSVEPTCTEDGYRLYECIKCGNQRLETIPKTGHITHYVPYEAGSGFHRLACKKCSWVSEELEDCLYATVDYKAPNCGNDGYRVEKCTLCDDTVTRTYPANGQHSEVLVDSVEATCKTAGYEVYECIVCGERRTVEIPATGVHAEYLNTEFENPYNHEYICSVCGEHIRYEAHRKGEPTGNIQNAICGECDGWTEYYCAVCGTAYKADYVVAEDSHKEEFINYVEPTCTTDGYEEYACTLCGEHRIVTIPATGNHVEKVVGYGHASTHDVVCSVCGEHIRYEAHEKGEPTGKALPSICGEQDGWTEYYCAKCGEAFKVYEIANYSHNEELIDYVEPTCVTDGYKEYLCYTCGHRRTETVPATGEHTEILNQDYAHPTNHEYVCSVCGEHTRFEAHIKGKVIEFVSPICGERDGYTEYYCSKCGNAFKTDYVMAEDSHYDIVYEGYGAINGEYGRHKATCSVCGLERDEDCTPDDFGICTCCGESVM